MRVRFRGPQTTRFCTALPPPTLFAPCIPPLRICWRWRKSSTAIARPIRTFRFNNGSTNRNHNYPSARTPPSPRRPPIPFLRATGRSYSVNTAMPWGTATARWPITSGFSAPPSVFKAASSGSGATTESGNPTDHGPTGGISATRHMTGIFVAMDWSVRIGFPIPHCSSTSTWPNPFGLTTVSGSKTARILADWIGYVASGHCSWKAWHAKRDF